MRLQSRLISSSTCLAAWGRKCCKHFRPHAYKWNNKGRGVWCSPAWLEHQGLGGVAFPERCTDLLASKQNGFKSGRNHSQGSLQNNFKPLVSDTVGPKTHQNTPRHELWNTKHTDFEPSHLNFGISHTNFGSWETVMTGKMSLTSEPR